MKVSIAQAMTGLFSFMGQIRLAVGQVNIVDHLVAIARKTTTPLVIEAQESYAPPQPTTRNVVLPEVGDIDPVIYYIDFRESSDGVSLGLLLAQFVYDLKNKVLLAERRFYFVNGPADHDPAAEQDVLSDPYLDGKTISGVQMRGLGNLVPPGYTGNEYELYTGGGIRLLNGKVFSSDDVWMIEISYLGDQIQVSGGGMYNGVVTLTEDTTMNAGHRNKRLRCASNASSRQVHTLEDLATVPEGTFYHFTFNDGNQFQTRILPFTGQLITYTDSAYTEMSLGRGEFLRIEKIGTIWEATLVHTGILQVGERFPATWKDHPNTKPEDATLFDGDDWPRPWWWIKNKLPVTHFIIDDNVVNGGYTHPAGKEGLFVVHSTLKKFRLPNSQNISERGLKSFTTYNADPLRDYDYPGGVQNAQVGEINFDVVLPKAHAYTGGPNASNIGNGAASPQNFNYPQTINAGKENTVKNIGVLYLRRF